jgi:hypothetical protein
MERGRPSDYNTAIAERICTEIATTSEGLESICNRIADFPDPRTIYIWRIRHEDFNQMYARAKEQQAQLLADEIVSIADTTQPGEVVTVKPDGEERKIADMTEHRKLRIESRKWLAMKLLPRVYGEKKEVTGPDGGPVQFTVKSILEES